MPVLPTAVQQLDRYSTLRDGEAGSGGTGKKVREQERKVKGWTGPSVSVMVCRGWKAAHRMRLTLLAAGLAWALFPALGCSGATYYFGPDPDSGGVAHRDTGALSPELDASTIEAEADGGSSPVQGMQHPPAPGDSRGSSMDGTTSASPMADASSDTPPIQGPFCTLADHRFCDDFDEGPVGRGWQMINRTGGTVALDPTTSISPPNSLLVQFVPLALGGALRAGLATTFPMPAAPSTVVWDFRLQVAAVDPTPHSGAVIAALDSFDDVRNRYSVQFTLYPQADGIHLWFEEESGFANGKFKLARHELPGTLSLGVWTEIRVAIDFTSAKVASVRIYSADALVMTTPLTVTVGGSLLQMTIGSSFETLPSLGWQMRYDNVTLDF